MDEEPKELINPTVDTEVLQQRLLAAKTTTETKEIVDLFNLSILKKDVLRAQVLSGVQDKVVAQMQDRVDKFADNFSNKDLLDYMETIQETLDKSTTETKDHIPAISLQQNTVNITTNELNKDSREKIRLAINSVIKAQKQAQDTTPIIIDAETEEDADADNPDESQ